MCVTKNQFNSINSDPKFAESNYVCMADGFQTNF